MGKHKKARRRVNKGMRHPETTAATPAAGQAAARARETTRTGGGRQRVLLLAGITTVALLAFAGCAMLLMQRDSGSAADKGRGHAKRGIGRRDSNERVHRDASGKVDWTVKATFVHDRKAFTQGLLWQDGKLYESTGLYGKSQVRLVEPTTGKVIKSTSLPSKYFGEGLTLWGDKLVQLTWKSGRGFVLNSGTLKKERSFSFRTMRREGWGLTNNKTHLIVTDGSEFVYVWDPETFREVQRVPVTDQQGAPLLKLNELEYVGDGRILANVWYDPRLFLIDISTGSVLRSWNFHDLVLPSERYGGEDCFNGIALDPASGDIYLTGKLWSRLYRVELPGYVWSLD